MGQDVSAAAFGRIFFRGRGVWRGQMYRNSINGVGASRALKPDAC